MARRMMTHAGRLLLYAYGNQYLQLLALQAPGMPSVMTEHHTHGNGTGQMADLVTVVNTDFRSKSPIEQLQSIAHIRN